MKQKVVLCWCQKKMEFFCYSDESEDWNPSEHCVRYSLEGCYHLTSQQQQWLFSPHGIAMPKGLYFTAVFSFFFFFDA